MRAVGGQVGAEAAKVFLSIELPAVTHEHNRVQESGAPLGLWKRVPRPEAPVRVRAKSMKVTLPLDEQMPLDEAEGRVAAAQGHLDELRAMGAPDSEIESATFVIKRANMTLFRSQEYCGKTDTQIDLHLFQIGPVVFAGVEGEPFFETGLESNRHPRFPQPGLVATPGAGPDTCRPPRTIRCRAMRWKPRPSRRRPPRYWSRKPWPRCVIWPLGRPKGTTKHRMLPRGA